MTDTLRIATRQSPLALWQAEHVASQLRNLYPDLTVALVGMTTRGDRMLETPLATIGGKGLFVKELEQGLQEDRADIAVHSMKDVPVELPTGLHLPVILEREDPRDAWVSARFERLGALSLGARVGTASLRRQCQILAHRSDLALLPLRGNVNTRLKRLDEGRYEGIVLAAAGLIRLGMADRIRHLMPLEESLPAIGQGAIGIECRQGDTRIEALIAPLHHAPTAVCVQAERALNRRLQGGCQVPIAGHAWLVNETLHLHALVGHPQGHPLIRDSRQGSLADAEALGADLGEALLQSGAREILDQLLDA
ncbi:hydroxymethylbilane synthase [Gammaproteobacteria bacterium]